MLMFQMTLQTVLSAISVWTHVTWIWFLSSMNKNVSSHISAWFLSLSTRWAWSDTSLKRQTNPKRLINLTFHYCKKLPLRISSYGVSKPIQWQHCTNTIFQKWIDLHPMYSKLFLVFQSLLQYRSHQGSVFHWFSFVRRISFWNFCNKL